jgi:hypothetical protein
VSKNQVAGGSCQDQEQDSLAPTASTHTQARTHLQKGPGAALGDALDKSSLDGSWIASMECARAGNRRAPFSFQPPAWTKLIVGREPPPLPCRLGARRHQGLALLLNRATQTAMPRARLPMPSPTLTPNHHRSPRPRRRHRTRRAKIHIVISTIPRCRATEPRPLLLAARAPDRFLTCSRTATFAVAEY